MARRLICVEWPDGADPFVDLRVFSADDSTYVQITLSISLLDGTQYDKAALHSVMGALNMTEAQAAFDAGGQEALFQWMEGRLGGN